MLIAYPTLNRFGFWITDFILSIGEASSPQFYYKEIPYLFSYQGKQSSSTDPRKQYR